MIEVKNSYICNFYEMLNFCDFIVEYNFLQNICCLHIYIFALLSSGRAENQFDKIG